MDLIILIVLLVLGAVIIAPLMAYQANQKANRLQQQLSLLQKEVAELKKTHFAQPANDDQITTTNFKPKASIPEQPSIPAEEAKPITVESDRQPIANVSTEPTVTVFQPNAVDKFLIHLQSNWLVWVGGLALVIGAAYLIQVVGSNFSFPPIIRVLSALLISLILIAFGEFTHRKIQAISHTFFNDKADVYIPATLYAAGISGLYATTIFSTVIYQMTSPGIALVVMTVLALLCLSLTQRLGPLLCALGLFGGYSAPIWIGGQEANYWLLTCYICIISIAGLLVKRKVSFLWVPTAICVAHSLWLALIVIQLPQDSLTWWFIAFTPLSVYLLLLVPTMGWQITLRHRNAARWPYFHPLLPAILLSFINGVLWYRTWHDAEPNLIAYLLPSLLLILPVVRSGLTARFFYSVTLLAILMGIINCGLIAEQYQVSNNGRLSNWLIFALFILLVSFRVISQYLFGDKHRFAYWFAAITQPLLLVSSAVYLNHFHDDLISYWALFSLAMSFALLALAHHFKQLTKESAIGLHAVIFTLIHCFVGDHWLPLAITLQIALCAYQYQQRFYSPGSMAVKLLMTLLIIRMSLIPFIPQWQLTSLPTWSWVLSIFLPTMVILASVHQWVLRQHQELREWIRAAILHLLVILIFAQSNYYLLGGYDFVAEFSFYSVALFASQTIILATLYQYKQSISNKLKRFYQGYAAVLAVIAALLMLDLNTHYQPLLNTYILGSDWPIFNWLLIGWAIPALTLIIAARHQLYTAPVKAIHLYSIASVIGSLWLIYSIRQFWQDGSLTLAQPTSMAEMLSYSIALIIIGAITTYYGVQRRQEIVQRCGLAILGIAVCKVFLLDTAALEGLWRAVSFLGLGGSLVALGWLFQKLNYKAEQGMGN